MEITFTFYDQNHNVFQRAVPFNPSFEAFHTLGWVVEHFATAMEDSEVNKALNTFIRTLADKMEAEK
jgi:hypothetical protein